MYKDIEMRRSHQREYDQRPEVRAARVVYNWIYNQKSSVKAKRKAVRQNPEYKANRKLYMQSTESRLRQKAYRQTDKYKLYRQIYRSDGKEARNSKRRYKDLRMKLLVHYGGNPPKCKCCGESIYEFLALDHIDGGGRKHVDAIGSGTKFLGWIIKNGYPPMFQVLCHNCNMGRQVNGGHCPHKWEKIERFVPGFHGRGREIVPAPPGSFRRHHP